MRTPVPELEPNPHRLSRTQTKKERNAKITNQVSSIQEWVYESPFRLEKLSGETLCPAIIVKLSSKNYEKTIVHFSHTLMDKILALKRHKRSYL
jgi:MinD-like ATPase involved in chromosome partitioning or flagellar assembly